MENIETFTTSDTSATSVVADRIMAQIVRVVDLKPIAGADRIELALVLGWQVIVQKGQFQIGDLAIYFNIGSVLDPTHPITATLAANLNNKPLKTIKMRKVLSQGLLTPITSITPINNFHEKVFIEDEDVTQLLNVRKYVEPEEGNLYTGSQDASRCSWPILIPKTDEPRLQNCPKVLNEIFDNEIVITQKYDGTSTTFLTLNNKFSVCSRNNLILDSVDNITNNNNRVYLEMAKKYNLPEKMLKLNKNLAIQGETIGSKINGNKHAVQENSFYAFNVYDIDLQMYLSWDEVVTICHDLGLNVVPVIYRGLCVLNSVNAFLELADKQVYSTKSICEGIVVKTNNTNDKNNTINRISFKVISNQYLLKYKL